MLSLNTTMICSMPAPVHSHAPFRRNSIRDCKSLIEAFLSSRAEDVLNPKP